MQKFANLIRQGESYFGSGGHTTPEFNSFFTKFNNAFKKELAKLGATHFPSKRNHFDLSGFFQVGEKWHYYSVSDVRWSSDAKMMVRTASGPRDFTGGHNNYVSIDDSIAHSISRVFRLEMVSVPG